jgi:hypothetical protein
MPPLVPDPVSCFHQSSLTQLQQALERAGYRVLRLEGAEATDKESFLAQVERDLPMPEGLDPGNWDAFADCLWGGLRELDDGRVAVVWTHAEVLLEHNLQTLLKAVGILTDTVRSVSTTEYGFSHDMLLRIVLIGDGPMFPPFPLPPT